MILHQTIVMEMSPPADKSFDDNFNPQPA